MSDNLPLAARPKILRATLAAAVVAGILLVTTILPAEYGIDPLGSGRALGLLALAGVEPATAEAAPIASGSHLPAGTVPLASDVYTVELRAYEGVEYKYRLEQGAGLIYQWEAAAPVEFEFHGEPDGAPAKYFDSYLKGTSSDDRGVFTAAKPGIHGWYWKNHGATRVTVTLRTSGFYLRSTEFRDGERFERTFDGASGPVGR